MEYKYTFIRKVEAHIWSHAIDSRINNSKIDKLEE